MPATGALSQPRQVACNHAAGTSLPQWSCTDVQDMVAPMRRQQLQPSPMPTLTLQEVTNASENVVALPSWICTTQSPYIRA
jgi:hypothetical protein